MLLRPEEQTIKLVAQSKDQQHSFNAPFQLARLPSKVQKKLNIKGFWNDSPRDANTYKFPVKKGDILVMGTDGLYDNMYTKDIIRIVNKYVTKELKELNKVYPKCEAFSSMKDMVECFDAKDASNIAKRLTMKAYQNSVSSTLTTPFGEKVNQLCKQRVAEGGCKADIQEWKGGKRDDISIIVALIL